MGEWTHAELTGLRLRVRALVEHVRQTHQAFLDAEAEVAEVAEMAAQRAAMEAYAVGMGSDAELQAEHGRARDVELGG